jgi:hypothetical protein
MTKTTMPKLGGGGGEESEGGAWSGRGGEGVELAIAIASNDHVLGEKVLNRKTEGVKFNGTFIVNRKTTSRDQVFDNMRNKKHVFKD